jgi:hypothetical protein
MKPSPDGAPANGPFQSGSGPCGPVGQRRAAQGSCGLEHDFTGDRWDDGLVQRGKTWAGALGPAGPPERSPHRPTAAASGGPRPGAGPRGRRLGRGPGAAHQEADRPRRHVAVGLRGPWAGGPSAGLEPGSQRGTRAVDRVRAAHGEHPVAQGLGVSIRVPSRYPIHSGIVIGISETGHLAGLDRLTRVRRGPSRSALAGG